MNFPFRWIPDSSCEREPAQVLALEMDQSLISPALSVQPEWNKGSGIIRGTRDKLTGELIEDHAIERLGPKGELTNTEVPIVGADGIRQGVWTVSDHLLKYRQEYPENLIVGWVGNGNLLSNPHFVAFIRNKGKTDLFHLRSEEKHFGDRAECRRYSCLVVRKREFAKDRPLVSIEDLQFWYRNGSPQVYSLADRRIVTEEINYATFGQRLVKNGSAINLDKLCQMANDEQFYDLRHLLLFGRLPLGRKRWIDIGLTAFWDEYGNLDKRKLVGALKGEVISVGVRQFPQNKVIRSIEDKGYVLSTKLSCLGQFSLKCGQLNIIFKHGIYTHNMIGIREDGELLSVVTRGLGNRVGVSVLGAAQIMKMLGAHDAIMIDNGGDVMMGYGPDTVLGSAEGERNKLRGMILFACPSDLKKKIHHNHLRLVVFPKQYKKSSLGDK